MLRKLRLRRKNFFSGRKNDFVIKKTTCISIAMYLSSNAKSFKDFVTHLKIVPVKLKNNRIPHRNGENLIILP